MRTKLALIPIILLFLSCGGSKSGFYYTTRANTTLYPGVQNPLEITSFGNIPVEISIQNGSLSKSAGNMYWITTGQDKGRVIVTFKQGEKTEEIHFRIQDFPSPVLSFRGKSYPDKTIPVSEFRESRMVSGVIPNFDYDVTFKLVSCKIITITPEGRENYYEISDSYLPQMIMSGIASGSKIIFYDCIYKTDKSNYIFKGEDCVYTLE